MRIDLRFIAFLLITSLFTNSISAQYTFTGNGSWTDPNNWEGGEYPGNGLHEENIITINGNAIMGICPTYEEGIECDDVFFDNSGTIVVSPNASLTLRNQNQFSNGGNIIIYGTLINETTFEGFDIGSVTIWGTFINQVGQNLYNPGWIGNQGIMTIENGGILDNRGIFDNFMFDDVQGTLINKSGGTIDNKPGATLILGTVTQNEGTINNSSVLDGNAIIPGSLNNSGTLAPGHSPGTYTINGDYAASISAIHDFEVGGMNAGSYDVLNVDGTVNLNGTLNILLIDGFTPTTDHEIPIITGTINGTFQNVNIPASYKLVYKSNEVVLQNLNSLPVTFIGLEAKKGRNSTKLTWKVADEYNVLRYEIEKSGNGHLFTKIGAVSAASLNQYFYSDQQPEPISYYRVKSVDEDGKYQYSEVILVQQQEVIVVLKAFPLPVVNKLVVQHRKAGTNSRINIASIEGKMIRSILLSQGIQQTTIDLSGINAGVYLLQYRDGKENIETIKIVKQ